MSDSQQSNSPQSDTPQSNQYLTFKLDDEVFAFHIDKVREVLDFETVTKVPQMPDFMRGVINLRGNVVPVVDMRLKLALEAAEQSVHTCVIIVEVVMGEDRVVLGAMADSVQEVIELEAEQIEPAPRLGSVRHEFLRGMGKRDGRFVMVLDVDRVFAMDEPPALPDEPCGAAADSAA